MIIKQKETNPCKKYSFFFQKINTYHSVIYYLVLFFLSSVFPHSLDASENISSSFPLTLFANSLIFNYRTGETTAKGNVQLNYAGNKIFAEKIIYNQKSGRVFATNNVMIIDIKGNTFYVKEINLSNDLQEGFAKEVYVLTPEKVHLFAEKAKLQKGPIIILSNASFTPCTPCKNESRIKHITWQIRTQKMIWNHEKQILRFENSQFHFFGIPIFWLPVFSITDPSVKRTNGFLIPHIHYRSKLGIAVRGSWFFSPSAEKNFLLSATGYREQGILGQAEWKQQYKRGIHALKFAAIRQHNPKKFSPKDIDFKYKNRFMIASLGQFYLNPYWRYGWDIMAQSDRNFSRTYAIKQYNQETHLSKIYLNGTSNHHSLNLHAYRFLVQEDLLKDESTEYDRHILQPIVLPRIDYIFSPQSLLLGGVIKFTANLQALYRKKVNFSTDEIENTKNFFFLSDKNKRNARLSGEIEWKRNFTNALGVVMVPILSLRSDAVTNSTKTHFANYLRSMATIGTEIRYPLLLNSGQKQHIIEPIAQFFIRNNESHAGKLANEDAQSLVFDATTLFLRNKFSGYDRVEGGIRSNIGLRYLGDLGQEWIVQGLGGQSFHLGGLNSYAVNTPNEKKITAGLEKESSDYVAMLNIGKKNEFSLAMHGKFNEQTLKMHYVEVDLKNEWNALTLDFRYSHAGNLFNTETQEEISFGTNYRFNENWHFNGRTGYDFFSKTLLWAGSGFSYVDECMNFSLGYLQTRISEKQDITHKWGFQISLRTLSNI